MKIDKLQMTAVIPVQQYGNIQPSIELSEVDFKEGTEFGLSYIRDLFSRFSEKGGLTEHDVVLSKLTRKSFNEDGVDIEFEPVAHTYTYQGKPLVGATDFLKKFYKPFDVDAISSILESKWGIPQQVIRDLWEKNGEITSDFGNLVDKTLCYYEKFKSYGEIISSQQKEEKNYCLPKQPFLLKVVEEFYALVKDGDAKIITQVMLSSVKDGVCGQADRIRILDEQKKICRVQDFKVNIDAEKVDKKLKVLAPFDTLPANKISKYQLQLSLYANMLQKSGWTVDGLDVFVYEDTWKHFELPVLQVI